MLICLKDAKFSHGQKVVADSTVPVTFKSPSTSISPERRIDVDNMRSKYFTDSLVPNYYYPYSLVYHYYYYLWRSKKRVGGEVRVIKDRESDGAP